MMTRLACSLTLLIALLTLTARPVPAQAQTAERYHNPALGVAFDLPAGWQIEADVPARALLAGAPGDVALVQASNPPQGLIVRMLFGAFNELGIRDATELPALLDRVVGGGAAAAEPQRTEWGNASGHEALVTLPTEGLTTRVALLAVAGGRVAIVRGIAPTPVWDGGASATFSALTASLVFSLPERNAGLVETITAHDGGVLWQLVTPPADGRVVRLGGLVYDPFNVMYIAAGPGGILTLEMNSGRPISFMGPWHGADFADVALGPDMRLYLANRAADTPGAVMVVDRAGNWGRAWGARGDGEGEFAPGMPQTIAVTRDGAVWTVSEGHSSGIRDRLYSFDAVGNLLLTADLAAINPDLHGVRLAANDRTAALYAVGMGGALTVIDADGDPLVVNLAQEILQGLTPLAIAIAPDDNLVLAVAAPGLDSLGLLELSVGGKLLDMFGLPYDEARGGPYLPGEYLRPGGLVMAPDGTGFWTETHPDTGFFQAQRFTFSGDGLLPLGVPPPDEAAGEDAGAVLSADPAQGGGEIAYGQTVRGALNNRHPSHEWTFSGDAGDHVIITMRDASGAGLLDPRLVLRNADGRQIAANDDVGALRPEDMAERDALIDFFLPATGTFTIEAGRFGGRGEYLLTLERVTP
jgi:hypothetical protein